MTVSVGDFRSGMRQLAAAVNVVTTRHEGVRAGMTATAVMSLTADPPQIAVAVNRSNASFATMVASGVFAVNVLPHDHADLASVFAGVGGLKGDERFASGEWGTLETGAPILLDSTASFDCEIAQMIEFSSHMLVIGLVKAIRLATTATPLLYIDGGWASLVRASDSEFEAYGRLVEGVSAAIDSAVESELDAGAQLASFSRSFVELSAASVEVLRDFHAREYFVPAQKLAPINARKRQVEAKVRDLLHRGALTGEFAIADPDITADAIIGMLNALHRSPRWSQRLDAGEAAQVVADLVAAMVGASRSAQGERLP